MFSLIEHAKIVEVQAPKDMTGAAITTEWINMKNAQRINFLIALGVMTSTDNQAVQLYVADDASGTHNVALGTSADLKLEHNYSRAASGDTWAKNVVSSSTFNLTKSSDGKTFLVEVDAAQMGKFTKSSVSYDADYIRLAIASPGAHACLTSVYAILTGLRYGQATPPTAIT